MAKKKYARRVPVEPPAPPPEADPAPVDMSAFDEPELTPDDPSPYGDVLQVDPARLKVLQGRGTDTTITRARVERFNDETRKFERIDGEWPPDMVTAKWIRKKWGGGRYLVRGVNTAGIFIATGAVSLGSAADPSAPVAPVAAPAAPQLSFQEQMLLALVANRQPPPADDGLREAMSAMAKMMTMQLNMQAMQRMQTALVPAAPAANGHEAERLTELLKTLLEGRLPGVKREQTTLAEILPILQLGLTLGRAATGAGGALRNPEDEIPAWLRILPGIADTVGVPLIATIAQGVLPPDKAEQVIKTITEHQRARQAEAEADMAAADDDAPVVPGVVR
jgi:hypothetical protein